MVFSRGLDLGDLRRSGWLFDMGKSAHEPWHKFWSYYGELIFYRLLTALCIYHLYAS